MGILDSGTKADLRDMGKAGRRLVEKVAGKVKDYINPDKQLIHILTEQYYTLINDGKTETVAKQMVMAMVREALKAGIEARKNAEAAEGEKGTGGNE